MSNNIIDLSEIRMKKMEERFDQLVEESEAEDEFIGDFAIAVLRDVVDAASEYGYDIFENPESIKDIIFAIEVLRGLLFRIKKIKYHTHDLSDRLYDFDDYTNTLKNFVKDMDF